jgi:hypothetical protein
MFDKRRWSMALSSVHFIRRRSSFVFITKEGWPRHFCYMGTMAELRRWWDIPCDVSGVWLCPYRTPGPGRVEFRVEMVGGILRSKAAGPIGKLRNIPPPLSWRVVACEDDDTVHPLARLLPVQRHVGKPLFVRLEYEAL